MEKQMGTRDWIKGLLMNTEREGMDKLVEHMEQNGFFDAPCSSQYHLCKPGGLAEHSLNVYDVMVKANTAHGSMFRLETIAIVALLHDLGKMGQYGKQQYVPNMLKGGKQSDAKPYTSNSDLLSVDHEIRSIHIASQFIKLTEQESFAILYHNGMYSNLKYALKDKETPLQIMLHFSDMWASRVVEG